MDDAVKSQLRSFIDLWNTTERVTKQAELINGSLIQPSINELRYAGRWIVLALNAIIKDEKRIDRLTTVENAVSYASLCCMQAKHDAIDSIVLFLHEKVDALNERYSAHIIGLYVKDYDHFIKEIAIVDKAIVNSRGERENRLELYETIVQQHLPKLVDFIERIKSAETMIDKAIADELRAQKIERERHEKVVADLTALASKAQDESARNQRYFKISMAVNAVLFILAILAILPDLARESSQSQSHRHGAYIPPSKAPHAPSRQ